MILVDINLGSFLPATAAECSLRGWDAVDIVLVSGDAYVDHPSFGVALIGRWLEAHGFRVAILAQPDYRQGCADFKRFGRPRLFFGITAGNLDSIVANYTGNGKLREDDPFSPDGNPYFSDKRQKSERRRPDRATLIYANHAQAAWPGVPVILGGLEASLRRFIHYDYRQEKLRSSILADAKADLLVYGMGERAVLEIARRLDQGQDITGIAGTCEFLRPLSGRELIEAGSGSCLPGWSEIAADPKKFMLAELKIDERARLAAQSSETLLQEQKSGWIKENPPAASLTPVELDRLYELPFARRPHPRTARVPAFTMIRDSLTIVRGCSGNCSFCALTRHQGARVVSRSKNSIVREARIVAAQAGFSGIISDLGGPTANLYATSCAGSQSCRRHDCLYPQICPYLKVDEKAFISLLAEVTEISGVKKVLVSSGLRLALLRRTPKLLACLIARHLPGVMKIAPEHSDPEVLRLMHKNDALELNPFLKECRQLAQKAGVKVEFTPYLIASHPGSTVKAMRELAQTLLSNGLKARQYQDFTPTPGTLSTAMYVTGLDRDTLVPIHVANGASERSRQRQELEKVSGRIPFELRNYRSAPKPSAIKGKAGSKKPKRVT
ncbi:MAG: YgiQ family radical SAM protein [Deltaproteobacteria bacterium]|nr:YgiQ family radical SAM protein [Deltaproteobacteria bacterium]